MSNEMALQKYKDAQEKKEKSEEMLFDKLDNRLYELSVEIQRLIRIASDYDGLDFSQEMREAIRDLV